MTKYYLGRPVVLLPHHEAEDGWIWAKCHDWSKGQTCKFWQAQLHDTPWGK